MIKFYYHHTPNPLKVALFFEEAGLSFEVMPVDILKGDQHTPDFRAINPNGKVPAITDNGIPVFDSTAILLYLADKSGKLLGKPEQRAALLSWLMFIGTGLGPFSGQCVHFTRVHKDSAYATNRYRRELERHYTVLDEHLKGRNYIVGDTYTIADISAWGWIDRAPYAFDDQNALSRWPNIKRWFDAVNARPAVARARKTGEGIKFKSDFDEESLRAMFPSNFAGK